MKSSLTGSPGAVTTSFWSAATPIGSRRWPPVSANGIQAEGLVADLGDANGLARVERRIDTEPSLTLLVNSAGLIGGGPLSAANLDGLTGMLDVNVTALTRLSAVAARAFAARGEGAIINLSSAMAFIDSPTAAAYAASKAYVLSLTLSLDLDLRPRGVRVQAVLPGYTRTPMIGGGAGLPDEAVMDAGDLVDAALAGFDSGELVTIPSLESPAAYANWAETRTALQPFLSLSRPATRYPGRSAGPGLRRTGGAGAEPVPVPAQLIANSLHCPPRFGTSL